MIRLSRPSYTAVALAFLAVTGTSALASGSHEHPAENGSAKAPLNIVRPANDLAPPITRSEPATIKVKLDTIEVTGQLADGAAYHYWTFNKKVPGPFVRARVGDAIQVGSPTRLTATNVTA